MKRIIPLLVASLLACTAALADEAPLAPDWQLFTIDNEVLKLSDAAAEQPVVVLFWATWCPYCTRLMPHLQEIQDAYGDKVRVLAVHFRDDNGDAVAYMENKDYDFTLLRNGDSVAKLNGIWGTPGVLIIDQQQKVQFNLYDLKKLDFPDGLSHGEKAQKLAPYWAGELRATLDRVVR
ncbi:MAG: TlpA disulfide reductase family protein [Pseudomonadota bacterium]